MRDRILLLLQQLSDAGAGDPDLSSVTVVCSALRRRGVEFPAQDLDEMAPVHTPRGEVELRHGGEMSNDAILFSQRTQRELLLSDEKLVGLTILQHCALTISQHCALTIPRLVSFQRNQQNRSPAHVSWCRWHLHQLPACPHMSSPSSKKNLAWLASMRRLW